MLNNAALKQYNIKQYNIKIVKHNIVQHLHSATVDSATVNNVTRKSATSKSATSNSEILKQYNINSEIRNSATLISVTLNRGATSNSEHLIVQH